MEPSAAFRIERFEAPAADVGLVDFLRHKGSPWVEDIHRRLAGQCPGSADRFFVAYDGDRLAAHAWYAVAQRDRRLGLLGHVFTQPEYRRRGLATRVIEAATADFAAQGGRVLQLFTYNPLTVPFYERLGFEQLRHSRSAHAGDWSMRWPPGAESMAAEWLAPAAARIRDLAAADLPQYCLVYNLDYSIRLKDWAQGIGLGLEAEAAFITTRNRVGGACRVLDNGQTIVGAASLMPCSFAHQAHVATVDCYVHPRFAAEAANLLADVLSLRERLGVEFTYALAVDEAKARLFESLGLRPCARLEGHYQVEGKRLDAELYSFPRTFSTSGSIASAQRR